MSRLLGKEVGLFLIPLADRFIGRDAPDAAVSAVEVVMHEPMVQIRFHLRCVLVNVLFGRARLNQTIGALDQAVGLGCVRLGLAMFNLVLLAQLGKGMQLLSPRAPAILEGGLGELASVIRENLGDLKRVELQTAR